MTHEQLALNDLETIIDGPGTYITRDGRHVNIYAVKSESTGYTFRAKGSIFKMFRGKVVPRGYQVWHVSGRLLAVGLSPSDIIGKVEK